MSIKMMFLIKYNYLTEKLCAFFVVLRLQMNRQTELGWWRSSYSYMEV